MRIHIIQESVGNKSIRSHADMTTNLTETKNPKEKNKIQKRIERHSPNKKSKQSNNTTQYKLIEKIPQTFTLSRRQQTAKTKTQKLETQPTSPADTVIDPFLTWLIVRLFEKNKSQNFQP